MYPVQKGIPLPNKRKQGRYPMRKLQVGDSFLIPASEVGKNSRAAAYSSARYYGIRVCTRVQKDGAIRVWRIA